jgi:hypothetical protein
MDRTAQAIVIAIGDYSKVRLDVKKRVTLRESVRRDQRVTIREATEMKARRFRFEGV